MSSRSKKILSMALGESDTNNNNEIWVESNINMQNVEVITQDGFLMTSLNYCLEDSLQPKVFTELTNVIELDENLNIPQQQNSSQFQGENSNTACCEFIRVCAPFKLIDNQLILNDSNNIEESVNEPEHIEEPSRVTEKELEHTQENVNEVNAEKGLTKSGNPRKRRKIDKNLKQKIIIEKQEKLLENHRVLPGCRCKKKCCDKIAEDQRTILNTNFWKLSARERKSFILNNCIRLEVKRRTTESERKQNTFKYKLKTVDGQMVDVCKTFFLTTLGYKNTNDRVLHDTLKKTPKNQLYPQEDRRTQSIKKKINYDVVDAHIESFQPFISHYRREHAPNRRYLPSDISISVMFDMFKSQYPDMKVSYESYRLRVKAKNISFASLGHEECEQCEEYKMHGHQKEDLQENCEKCTIWKKHMDHARDSRELYQEHAQTSFGDGTVCFSVDLQKVIMLPRVDTFKRVLFIKRLTTYNESFVPLGKKSQNKAFAVLWNEAISGRDKEDIISCFYTFFLKYRDSPKIILWLDNCSSQNKNWCLLSFLVRIINSTEICANEIFLNFFEPGHTFMSADSFHHQVELSLKKKGKVYDFDDFVEAVQKAQKSNTEVKVMSHQDFFKWKDLKSEAKLKKQERRIYLSDIVQIKATRGNFFLQSKSSLAGEFEKLDFLYKKAMNKNGILSQIVPCRTEPRGFPKIKKDAILKNLCDIMPENRKTFWINLPETNDD